MLLGQRLEGTILVRRQGANFAGHPYWEVSLASDDEQTLHIYEGQLKEVPGARLEPGKRYRVILSPFVNNRWVEVKIIDLRPDEAEG